MRRFSILLFMLAVGLLADSVGGQESSGNVGSGSPQATSLRGRPLYPPAPPPELLERLARHRAAFESDPDDPDALIWYGRFLAYSGNYTGAIDIFSRGIGQFPADARLWRHRAHRYITTRQFDKALADLDRAVALIEGQPDQIEPDGMPNPRNIPVSTLHGNIWYHKGLAHYLNNQLPDALTAFLRCRDLKSNDDNTVAATHWIYMILRRMQRWQDAQRALSDIRTEMNIVENFSYHRACLLYRQEIPVDTLLIRSGPESRGPADDALSYALGNWYWYNGDQQRARQIFEEIVARGAWASFGHIAAEADLFRMTDTPETPDSADR